MTLDVGGQQITFLVDPGATAFVILKREHTKTTKLSERELSVGANGHLVSEPYIMPLTVVGEVKGFIFVLQVLSCKSPRLRFNVSTGHCFDCYRKRSHHNEWQWQNKAQGFVGDFLLNQAHIHMTIPDIQFTAFDA